MSANKTDQSAIQKRSPERWAALDCGTNTVLLTIAAVAHDSGLLVALEERAEIVRLGAGLAETGRLSDEAVERTAAALSRYAEAIAAAGCTRVFAVGTEALRRASNGAEVKARLDASLAPVGATLQIIAGQREAQLCFIAVAGSFRALQGRRSIVDIGGGSTEIVVGDEAGIEAAVSLPIGSVVLTERFLHGDPPTHEERTALVHHVDETLRGAPPLGGTLVGIAATVTTYATLMLGLSDHDGARVHGELLSRDALDREVERIGGMTAAQRLHLPGVSPKRADLVYAGGVVLSRIMARAGATECLVSDRGVRWGLLYEAVRRDG